MGLSFSNFIGMIDSSHDSLFRFYNFFCRILIEFRTRKAHRWVVRDKDLLKYLLGMIIVVFGYMAAWTATNLDLISKENYSIITYGRTHDGLSFLACKSVWWDYVTQTGKLKFTPLSLSSFWTYRRAPHSRIWSSLELCITQRCVPVPGTLLFVYGNICRSCRQWPVLRPTICVLGINEPGNWAPRLFFTQPFYNNLCYNFGFSAQGMNSTWRDENSLIMFLRSGTINKSCPAVAYPGII